MYQQSAVFDTPKLELCKEGCFSIGDTAVRFVLFCIFPYGHQLRCLAGFLLRDFWMAALDVFVVPGCADSVGTSDHGPLVGFGRVGDLY